MVDVGVDHHHVLDIACDPLADRYRIGHVTLQIEPTDQVGGDELGC